MRTESRIQTKKRRINQHRDFMAEEKRKKKQRELDDKTYANSRLRYLQEQGILGPNATIADIKDHL